MTTSVASIVNIMNVRTPYVLSISRWYSRVVTVVREVTMRVRIAVVMRVMRRVMIPSSNRHHAIVIAVVTIVIGVVSGIMGIAMVVTRMTTKRVAGTI